MNKLYIAEWPNGTISIVSAYNKAELFDKLDEEGPPEDAKITSINIGDENIHITTDFKKNKNGIVEINDDANPEIIWGLGETNTHIKTRKVSFA